MRLPTPQLNVFQSTLPRGERQKYSRKIPYLVDFNPRSHEGSDQGWFRVWLTRKIFQSTLPRGERQAVLAIIKPHINFNPRSHEGSDLHWCIQWSQGSYFNPRSHEGSDKSTPARYPIWLISIHAPTRGATLT